jgi:hypothetical protein
MSSSPIPWKHIRNVLVLFAPLWCGVTLVFGTLGAGYALLKPDLYSASQPLVVRDEASSSVTRLGRFPSQTELKAAQKTIQEMTHNREVVAAALREIGPPSGRPDPDYPSTEVVDSIAGSRVNLLAPNGAEFGNTEVVYLQVKAKTQERAGEFCRAMLDNLTLQLRRVRQVRADSMIEELKHTSKVARKNLDEASQRMNEIEITFGTDLGELRNLNDAISGDGANRRALEAITDELNQAELALEKRESLYELLVAGSEDPQQLLINGGDLLADQPSLLRLKEGLIDAQIKSSQQSGVYTDANPKQRVALAAEKEIQARMQVETAAVIRAMEPMLKLEREQVAQLHFRKAELSKRLSQLAKARTDYAKIDAEVRQRTEQLAEAERALAEATAIRSAALSTNLVEDLGPPQVTDHPIGPSGSFLALGATMAGLICGLGAVFLIAPGPTDNRGGRRWSDHLQANQPTGRPAPTIATSAPVPVQPSGNRPTQPPANPPASATAKRPPTAAAKPAANVAAKRPANPPNQAPANSSVNQPAQQPVQANVQRPAQQSTKSLVRPSSQASAKQPAKNPVQGSGQAPATPTNSSAKPAAGAPAKQPLRRPPASE